MYKSNVFYQQFEVFITVSVFKNVNFVKPNWFVSLVFPIPEEGPAVPLVEAWLPFGRGNRRDTNQFVKKKNNTFKHANCNDPINETAYQLTRTGSEHMFVGPELACGISVVAKKAVPDQF